MKLRSGKIVNRIMSNRTINTNTIRDMDTVRDTIPILDTNPIIGTVVGYVEDSYDRESEVTEARDEKIVADAGRESVESQPPSIMLVLMEMKKMGEQSKQDKQDIMKEMQENILEQSKQDKQDRLEQSKRDKQDIMKKMEEQAEQNKQQFAQIQISLGHQFEAQDEKWESRMNDLKKTLRTIETGCDKSERIAEENMEKLESYVEREKPEMETLTEEWEEVKGKEHEKMIQINGEMDDKAQKISQNSLVMVERELDNCEINITEELRNDSLERIQEEILEQVQVEVRMGESPSIASEETKKSREVESQNQSNKGVDSEDEGYKESEERETQSQCLHDNTVNNRKGNDREASLNLRLSKEMEAPKFNDRAGENPCKFLYEFGEFVKIKKIPLEYTNVWFRKCLAERTSILYELEEEKDVNYDEVKQNFINVSMSYNKRAEILRKLYVPNFDKNRICREQYLLEVNNDNRQLDHPLPTPLFLLLYAS